MTYTTAATDTENCTDICGGLDLIDVISDTMLDGDPGADLLGR